MFRNNPRASSLPWTRNWYANITVHSGVSFTLPWTERLPTKKETPTQNQHLQAPLKVAADQTDKFYGQMTQRLSFMATMIRDICLEEQ